MGAVYLAHRADGNFEHKVAVKIIGLPFELERFQERLYLIMEYVDELRIDEYARSKTLSVSQWLDIFRQVAAAVMYAHQNLVVHRDL